MLILLGDHARHWFGGDTAAPAWEPSGDDFLSPTLMEAAVMQQLLPAEEFGAWFAAFLPGLAEGKPRSLFEPATVRDRSDGKLAHLDGLNFSRAWCMRRLALAVNGNVAVLLRAAANRHLAAALPHLADDYMGEHWLASFAALALDDGMEL